MSRKLIDRKEISNGPWLVVAYLVGHHPANRKVAGLIPWSGPMPGLWVWSLVRVRRKGNQLMFLTLMFLFLSFSLSLSIKPVSMSLDENKKYTGSGTNNTPFDYKIISM